MPAMTDTAPDFRKALPGYADPIPNDLLATVGRLLYGEDFAPPLADALGVDKRTVKRWKSGESRVTPRIANDLAALLADHLAECAKAAGQLAPYVTGSADPGTPRRTPRAG